MMPPVLANIRRIRANRFCGVIFITLSDPKRVGLKPGIQMKIKTDGFRSLTVFPENCADEKLMADLTTHLLSLFGRWHYTQVRQAVSVLKSAYRRGDIKDEEIRGILAGPNSAQHGAFWRPQRQQSLNQPQRLPAARSK